MQIPTDKNFTPITVPLGNSEVKISPLGLGAWSWGDRFFWGYGRDYKVDDIARAFQISLEQGVNWIDTAEVYGLGQSERLLGRFVKQLNGSHPDVAIATKFFPFPWRWRKGAITNAIKHSLQRLNRPSVDLYQVHFPQPDFLLETYAEELAKIVELGLTRAIGVSNYHADQMKRTLMALDSRGVPLASNQVHYSLLHRQPERNGIFETCREMNVSIIAYSPLEMGLLTGKYTPENPPPGIRSQRYSRRVLNQIQPLLKAIREIGENHGGKTPAQVALNWIICKGAIPIPGAKNVRQAAENAGSLGWKLQDDDIKLLDELSGSIEVNL